MNSFFLTRFIIQVVIHPKAKEVCIFLRAYIEYWVAVGTDKIRVMFGNDPDHIPDPKI